MTPFTLIVERTTGRELHPGRFELLYKAWVSDAIAGPVELPGVEYIYGFDAETAERMNYPTDVYVRYLYGSITVPRAQVSVVHGDAPTKVLLHRTTEPRHPWQLIYGCNLDCRCSYSTWQQAIDDLPRALALTERRTVGCPGFANTKDAVNIREERTVSAAEIAAKSSSRKSRS